MSWEANLVTTDAGVADILRTIETIAVLGAKVHPSQPAFFVPAYLHAQGYRIYPVNPTVTIDRLHDHAVVATLADLSAPVDAVEVFRRPEFLPGHAAEILALPWRPAVVWFQLGIRHDGAAERLARAGIRVVQNRCMMPNHRRLIGAA
jgi:predicted CoA-binding protein